ncbi:MAG: OsmC family protein [Bacteroidetes bacterium]|nr:OsmC family protein [Bacteroidota bacterium]
METIRTIYIGQLRTSAKHVQSGVEIITDAPVDNQGKGEAFSPTDLLAASLGSCVLTIMGISAREHKFDIDGTRIAITKIMVSNPRKVSEVKIEFVFPHQNYTEGQQRILKHAAHNCPVALSLHPDVVQNIIFNFNSI